MTEGRSESIKELEKRLDFYFHDKIDNLPFTL